jgi:hypothetical protein
MDNDDLGQKMDQKSQKKAKIFADLKISNHIKFYPHYLLPISPMLTVAAGLTFAFASKQANFLPASSSPASSSKSWS